MKKQKPVYYFDASSLIISNFSDGLVILTFNQLQDFLQDLLALQIPVKIFFQENRPGNQLEIRGNLSVSLQDVQNLVKRNLSYPVDIVDNIIPEMHEHIYFISNNYSFMHVLRTEKALNIDTIPCFITGTIIENLDLQIKKNSFFTNEKTLIFVDIDHCLYDNDHSDFQKKTLLNESVLTSLNEIQRKFQKTEFHLITSRDSLHAIESDQHYASIHQIKKSLLIQTGIEIHKDHCHHLSKRLYPQFNSRFEYIQKISSHHQLIFIDDNLIEIAEAKNSGITVLCLPVIQVCQVDPTYSDSLSKLIDCNETENNESEEVEPRSSCRCS